MPRFVDELKQDYQQRKGRVQSFAWTPQRVMYDPITPADLIAAQAGEPSSREMQINLLVKKAKDPLTGEPLFAAGDKHWLLNECATDRLNELTDALFMALPAFDDAKAAVDADPTSGSGSSSPTSSGSSSAT
jgi:hypothetical protein